MKTLFYLFLLICITSCNINQYQKLPDGKIRKPEIVNELYSTPSDSMIIKCQDLDGFGPFIIGKTTFKKASKHKEIFQYDNCKNSFYGYAGSWATSNDDIAKQLESSTKIKRLESSLPFKIGELKFNNIILAFYNDTLVGIVFEPEYGEKILNHYIQKYGNGDGHKILKNYFYKDYKKDKYYHDVEHSWYNNVVLFTYKEYFRRDPNSRTISSTEFLMTDRTGKFDEFINEYSSIKTSNKDQKNKAIEESFDLL